MSRRPLARDYKRSRHSGSGFDLGRWKEFAIGLAIGLAVAMILFVYQRNALDRATRGADTVRPEPRRSPPDPNGANGEDGAAAETPASYDFYEMLPKFEVVVPEKEPEVKRDIPTSPIERPGVYVLQAGSYRRLEDAERVKKQLGLQGITANVQRVSVDADVWHRVRIGPVSDLDEVNRLRSKLRHAEFDALVIRVGD
ncbi:MAG: SPOR domain-containing protein [Steroidobacteraceae bacterium]|nr:SPOR domain-containing protein [Nevskiaceae bacterium]MCP5340388.1 SPOR domain-containing protein [Nevskiaceae bacterium]MCP5360228.1 SPOR domain-containing protein [Nevskiaceae bacterium]MCP5466635.1 SPOR domain-containing protein [Nevskiaceae bacterium]